jgi:LacI family transcriptional regulator
MTVLSRGDDADPGSTPPLAAPIVAARGRRAATISDVARAAGVSLATASRALNGGRRTVGEELRTRVLIAAEQLQYRPNAHAQALAKATTAEVGLVVHDISDPYFAGIAHGVLEVATQAGLVVTIVNTFRDPERELRYTSLLRSHRPRAVILSGSGFTDPDYAARMNTQIAALQADGARVTCISYHDLAVDMVKPDNRGGAAEMARTLHRLGHRRIGVVSGPRALNTVRDRVEGFVQTLAGLGTTVAPGQIVDGGFHRDGAYAATTELMRANPRLTAIFAISDVMAIGCNAALRDLGLRVPDDVSLAGFDDIPIVRDLWPPLTTVRIGVQDLGVRAMQLSLHDDDGAQRVETIPSEIVLRASTAPWPPSRRSKKTG